MSAGSAEEKIRELARDLRPVRPIPPLRVAWGAALVLGLVAAVAHWLLGGPGLRPGGVLGTSPSYLMTLAGLVLLALGALGASLATAVPGREAAARLGLRAGGVGMALALAGGLWGSLRGGPAAAAELWSCLVCIGHSAALGAAPVLLACAFTLYAVVRRPGQGTALAVAGGVALGAAAVHTMCPSENPLHWLLAHTLAPVAAVLVLVSPLSAVLARAIRRL